MTMAEKFNTSQAAQKIGVNKSTLLRWLAQGKIPEVARDFRGWRIFTKEDIDRIIAYTNKIEPPPNPGKHA